VTVVFRSSSFFVMFVITLKATTFVVVNTSNGHGVADRLSERVERLVDESVRFRGEAREASDRVGDMAFALRIFGDRAIESAFMVARSSITNVLDALRSIVRFAHTNFCVSASAMYNADDHFVYGKPETSVKGVAYDQCVATGQCR